MKSNILLSLLFLLTMCTSPAYAGAERPSWDQQRALQRVRAVIAQEDAGDFAWEEIEWLTDPQKAQRLAAKEGKPIFLFFFLKGKTGPSLAPC